MPEPSDAVVVAVGNAWRGDDAAGLAVASLLRAMDPRITVVESDGNPTELIDSWEGRDHVFVVDAVSSGAPPGTIIEIEAGTTPIPAAYFRSSSSHLLGVAEAIELARILDRLPGRLTFVGIEAARFDAGAEMSDVVARSATAVAARLRSLLAQPAALEATDA